MAEIRQKSMEHNKIQTRFVSHGDWLTCQNSGQYLQAFKKKSGELFDRWNIQSPKPEISPKIDGV